MFSMLATDVVLRGDRELPVAVLAESARKEASRLPRLIAR